jgi:uncharacterized protein YecE (DUF72 family)
MDRFSPLEGRLGPILVQLPPSLSFDADRAGAFLEVLRPYQDAHRFALEARHESWMGEAPRRLLADHGVSLVVAHSGDRFPYHEAPTADFVYLRFHGPGQLYGSNYPEDSLEEFAAKVKRWIKQGLEVWAFFNNDIGGYAVANARRLRELVG